MDKLIDFPPHLNPGETYANIDPDNVLTGAVGKLSEVVIVGYEADGSFYFASTRANGPDVLWLLKQAEQRLLAIDIANDDAGNPYKQALRMGAKAIRARGNT